MWLVMTAPPAEAAEIVLVLTWGREELDLSRAEKAAGRVLESPHVIRAEHRLGHPLDLVDSLVSQPHEPTPALLVSLRDGLVAEQAAHPEDTLFVAVPYGARERELWIWRWDADVERLVRVPR